MPDQQVAQNIEVGSDITDADTGRAILTHEHAQQVRAEWTAQHPPIPGLRWQISFNLAGEVAERRLIVEHGWEDAYAPPAVAGTAGTPIGQDHAERLGALAYHGWFGALPENVREHGNTTWSSLPEPFQEPLRQAAVLVWQHGENAGFHQALLRTLPSAQLGAAGELENLADFIASLAKLYPGQFEVDEILAEIRARVERLRKDAEAAAKREAGERR